MSKEYIYNVYRSDTDRGYIRAWVRVAPDAVVVEDNSGGPMADEFYGTASVDMIASVNKKEARRILKANGVKPGSFPTELLGVWLANRLKSSKTPFSKFIDLAKVAGVNPEVNIW